jgi:hypothetical protein
VVVSSTNNAFLFPRLFACPEISFLRTVVEERGIPTKEEKELFMDDEEGERIYKKRTAARLLSRLDRREAEGSAACAGLGWRSVFDETWDLHPRGVRYVCMIRIAYQDALSCLFACPGLPFGCSDCGGSEGGMDSERMREEEGNVPY